MLSLKGMFTKSLANKLKRFWGNHYLLPSLISLAGAIFLVSWLYLPGFKNDFYPISVREEIVKGRLISTQLPSINGFLNFKNVEEFWVPGATKTVIYIPQIHKKPGSADNDAKNDQAVAVQKEIVGILGKLKSENNMDGTMDEADLYGPMPANKLEQMRANIDDINQIRKLADSISNQYLSDGGSGQVANNFKAAADKEVSKRERSIYLIGGAAVFAAKEPSVTVYGSQNKETIDKAKVMLQDITFMEERIAQLDKLSGKSTSSANSSTANLEEIYRLLGDGSDNIQSLISTINKVSDPDLLSQTKEFYSLLNKSNSTIIESLTASAPLNPYANTYNLTDLKRKHDNLLNEFTKIAKDQRSEEVSENIIKAMSETGQSSFSLVFGAGHKEQIIKDLNDKGVSVVVITPESAKNYQA